jgi:hypothetical protein
MRTLRIGLTFVGSILAAAAPTLGGTFQGTSSGIFGTPTGGPGDPIVFSGQGTNRIVTGIGVNSPPNSLQYDGQAFDTDADQPFGVGFLDYYNGATQTGTSATHFPIDITLTFVAPPGLPNQVFDFAFDLTLTPNTTGDPTEDGDIIRFPASFSSESFNYSGQDYTLKLLGFSRNNGATIENSFLLPENQRAITELFATVTTESNPNVVPVPPAALAGIALLASIQMVRSRRQRVL